MNSVGPSLVWFRNDLRVSDNPALSAAIDRGGPVAGLYVLELGGDGGRPLGLAALWKLHGALEALREALDKINVPLILKRGVSDKILPEVAEQIEAEACFWNRRYEPSAIAADKRVMEILKASKIDVRSWNGSLMVEPWQVKTKSGGWFKVFTPFCKAARAAGVDLSPIGVPSVALEWRDFPGLGEVLEDWRLIPKSPDWAGGLRANWGHGEEAARSRLSDFLSDGFRGYSEGRNFPAKSNVSGISPYLRFGEISPRQTRHAALIAAGRANGHLDSDFEVFERELYWRDFSYNLLFHADELPTSNFQAKFDNFPWRSDPSDFDAWSKGNTGYPIVDAGMRQLWETGWMHNRVRMIVASFLTKHLMIDWRQGESWFWDTLIDADAASNPSNWQWVAGSGADAAPYFRIFNPISQGEKFDGSAEYVRRWVPEIATLPNKIIHAPWMASATQLEEAGIQLGNTYPKPIVDHSAARTRALSAYQSIRS